MTVELSAEEIAIISDWYTAASRESAATRSGDQFSLLDKLGIPADDMHLLFTDLNNVYPEYREEYAAKNQAVREYLARHPEISGQPEPDTPEEQQAKILAARAELRASGIFG